MKNYQLQKGFVIPLILAIVALLAIGGGVFVYESKKVEAPDISAPIDVPTQVATTTTLIVGGDKDIHGCIGSAGYSWCEIKNKCLRPWEEKCEVTSTSTSDKIECQSNDDCTLEVSCPGNGGFAHQICITGKCGFAPGVKEMCTNTTSDPVVCTADAMMCPDGTYVGRTGPKCEFVCQN